MSDNERNVTADAEPAVVGASTQQTVPDSPAEWTINHVNHLVENSVDESQYLEYKKRLTPKSNQDSGNWWLKIEREIVAFANARGGHIVFGIEEDEDKLPTKITTIPYEGDLDKYINRAIQNTEPLVRTEQSHITVSEEPRRVVYVVKVEEAVRKPVRCHDFSFYRRVNGHKMGVDREQLMALFVDEEGRQVALNRLDFEVGRLYQLYEDFYADIELGQSQFDHYETYEGKEALIQLFDPSNFREVIAKTRLYEVDEYKGNIREIHDCLTQIEYYQNRYEVVKGSGGSEAKTEIGLAGVYVHKNIRRLCELLRQLEDEDILEVAENAVQ